MKLNLARLLTMLCLSIAMTSQGFAEEGKNAKDSAAVKSAETAADTQGGTYYLCKLNHVVRTVRVDKNKGGTCEATYTKEGVDRVVGKSGTVDRCIKVISNIKENLEKAAWKCKDISQARVSSSTEN